MIYFDNSATSYHKPSVVKNSVIKAINEYTANPGRSGHRLSQKVAEKVFDTRESVKKLFHAVDYDVIFTKNCTEALNLAIFGSLKPNDHVITTVYEHNSVLRPLERLKNIGVSVTIIDKDMEFIPNEIEKHLKPNTKMIITTHVSNVTGEVCDIMSVGRIARKNNITYLVDGAQSAGHIDIDLERMNVDMYTFAGHKGLMSITGVGGLIKKSKIMLTPLLCGGTGTDSMNLIQPNDSIEGYESGTLPTIAIISLGAGVEFLLENFKKISKREKELTKYLYNELEKLDFIKIYSKNTSINVISFNLDDLDSNEVANVLNDEYHICVRSGLHCAPLIHKKLNTLSVGALRISIDYHNTKEEIDYFITVLKKINDAYKEESYK